MRWESEYRLNGGKGLERTAPFSLCQRNHPISRNISTVKVNSVMAMAVKKAFCIVSERYFWCRGFSKETEIPFPSLNQGRYLSPSLSSLQRFLNRRRWTGGVRRFADKAGKSFLFNLKKLGRCHAFETRVYILQKTCNTVILRKSSFFFFQSKLKMSQVWLITTKTFIFRVKWLITIGIASVKFCFNVCTQNMTSPCQSRYFILKIVSFIWKCIRIFSLYFSSTVRHRKRKHVFYYGFCLNVKTEYCKNKK